MMEESQSILQISDVRSIATLQPESNSQDKEICKTPLLNMIKEIINVRKFNLKTMNLTNSHLLEILKLEFNINVGSEFDVEMYITVIKKFLKQWPHWDTLDNIVSQQNDNEDLILNNAYESLKEYLSQIFTSAKESIKYLHSSLLDLNEDEEEVVLQISCSRLQLNNLIFRKPDPNLNIFNITSENPTPDVKEKFDFAHILNWPMVKMSISLPEFDIIRTNNTNIERTLLNLKCIKNSIIKDMAHPLKTASVYFRSNSDEELKIIPKDVFLKYLNRICPEEVNIGQKSKQNLFNCLLGQLIKDFSKVPDTLQSGDYRINLHKYKYIRRLSVDMDDTEKPDIPEGEDINLNNYDLQLQELLTPQVEFCLDKINFNNKKNLYNQDNNFIFAFNDFIMHHGHTMKFECMLCFLNFKLPLQYDSLVDHFNKEHCMELEWECTGCQKLFDMKVLARDRWTHNCLPND